MRPTLLAILLALLTSCAPAPRITAERVPQPGWTLWQVEQSLGRSLDVAYSADSEVWRYGIAKVWRFVQPLCDHHSSQCLSIAFYRGKVIDVTRGDSY